jgi:translation initiation factor 4B
VEAREITDWSRKGPLPDLPGGGQQRRTSERGGGFGGGYEAAGGAPMERGGSRRSNFGGEGDGKVRDFSNWERKGPLSPVPGGPPGGREGRPRGEPRERRSSPSWGEGSARSQDGSRPPTKREYSARPPVERQPTAAEMDNQWRSRMKPDAPAQSGSPTPEPSVPSSPAQPAAPTARPRLNLAKRTVSEAQPATDASGSDSKASPFGAARPIDTATREKEVAEKRELAIRQKREADEKTREEKKAREAATKEESEADDASENSKANSVKKENGDASKKPNYQILSRGNDDGEEEDKEGQDADANDDIVDDKAAKPREFVREPPRGPRAERRGGGGNEWRRKSSTPATPV